MSDTLLVSAIGGDVGNSILKCLACAGFRLIGTDVNEYPVGMDRVAHFYRAPYADTPEYLPFMLDLCAEHQVTRFIPVNESEIRAVSAGRERFERQGVRVLAQPQAVLDACMDKYCLPAILKSAGLPALKTCLPENFLSDGGEYVVKLRCSSGSRLVQRIRTKEELATAAGGEPVIVQEYVPAEDDEITIGVFAAADEVRSIAFRRTLKHGYTQFVELVADPDLEVLAEKVARALPFEGCFNIQLRRRCGVPYIFEINPRISGTAYFRHQLGFTDALWWLELAAGSPIAPFRLTYRHAIGVREMNEKFLVLDE